MKLNMHNVAGTYYTEYVVKPGETLKQIAKDQLYNENLMTGIYRLNNSGTPETKPIDAAQNLAGWVLLIPPVPPAVLMNHAAASKKLTEIKESALKGLLSAEDYYAQRKLVLSVL